MNRHQVSHFLQARFGVQKFVMRAGGFIPPVPPASSRRLAGTPSRHGKTLIELLVIIAGSSALMLIAAQLLHRLSKTERSVRESSAVARAEIRLARAFREDVRSASAVESFAGESGHGLRLAAFPGAIEYVAEGGLVRRTEHVGDLTRHEAYRFGRTEATFTLADGLAVVTVEPLREGTAPKAAPGAFEVVAAVGADRLADAADADAPAPDEPAPVEAPQPAREDAP